MIGDDPTVRTQPLSCSANARWNSLVHCVPMKCAANLASTAATDANAEIVNPSADPTPFGSPAIVLRCKANHAVFEEISEGSGLKTKTGSISLRAECALTHGETVPKWRVSKTCVPVLCTDPSSIIAGKNAVIDGTLPAQLGIGVSLPLLCRQHYIRSDKSSAQDTIRCKLDDPGLTTGTWDTPKECV
eukprot:903622_1